MFINNEENVVLYAKLTDYGRRQIARGHLDYTTFVLGDSEIDYRINPSAVDFGIFRPFDNSPDIKYHVKLNENASEFNSLKGFSVYDKKVVNVAKERGFFNIPTSGSTLTFNTSLARANGTFTTPADNQISASGVEEGDIVMLYLNNSDYTKDTNSYPTLFAKAEEVAGSTVTLDRNIKDGGSVSGRYYAIPSQFSLSGDPIYNYYGSGTTVPYWDDASLSFQTTTKCATDDVPVWNMNIVHRNTIEGTQTDTHTGYEDYGSLGYIGMFNYFNQNEYINTIALIHWSNSTIANFYAEGFYKNTAVLEIPFISHNESGRFGVTVYCDDEQKRMEGINSDYYDLLISGTSSGDTYVVGKHFPDLKLFLIDDPEMATALSYKGNRNWTLPKINFTIVPSPNDPVIDFEDNEDLWITYRFADPTYVTGIHCQKLVKVTKEDVENCFNGIYKCNIQLTLNPNELNLLRTDEQGFKANEFYVLVQKVDAGEMPDPNNWVEIDYTSDFTTPITKDQFKNKSLLLDNTAYTGGTSYDLDSYIDIPELGGDRILHFGDERLFMGNVKGQIEASVFQSNLYLLLNFDEFNYSNNPSWDCSLNYTLISEVGIYDSNNRLVVIGKLGRPVKKNAGQVQSINLSIDF